MLTETIHYYEITTLDGLRYGIQAVDFDGQFAPHISVLNHLGEPVETVVDSADTDEVYGTARECLLRATAHVL
jgi:hypothetical protein